MPEAEAMSAAGLRYRIVTRTDDEEHIGSGVYSGDETPALLDLEAHLLEAWGWNVTRIEATGGYLVTVLAENGRGTLRMIFARAFSPFTDSPKEATT